jgi:hypothetical protein
MLVMIGINKLSKISIITLLFISSMSIAYAMEEYSTFPKSYKFIKNVNNCMQEIIDQKMQTNSQGVQPLKEVTNVTYAADKKIINSKGYKNDDLEFSTAVNHHIHNLLVQMEKKNLKGPRALHDVTNIHISSKPETTLLLISPKMKENETLKVPLSKSSVK